MLDTFPEWVNNVVAGAGIALAKWTVSGARPCALPSLDPTHFKHPQRVITGLHTSALAAYSGCYALAEKHISIIAAREAISPSQ